MEWASLVRDNLGKSPSIERWGGGVGVDLLMSMVQIADKAQLLVAIGPFPASVSFRQLPVSTAQVGTIGLKGALRWGDNWERSSPVRLRCWLSTFRFCGGFVLSYLCYVFGVGFGWVAREGEWIY